MKKTNPILMLTAVFVVIFVAACSTPATPAPQVVEPAVEQPAQQEPAAPVATAAPVESAPTEAPASGGTFVFPDTVAAETYCVTKIPYQNLFLDQGVTFEPQDPKGELKCTDSGTEVDGKNVITCTGKELWTYDLKLTDANNASTVIKVNIGACPAG
jgi:hypothetical protein